MPEQSISGVAARPWRAVHNWSLPGQVTAAMHTGSGRQCLTADTWLSGCHARVRFGLLFVKKFIAHVLAKDDVAMLRCARRGVVFRVVFHPKQLMVISGGDDSDVRIWDLVTKTCPATLKVCCRRSADGRRRCGLQGMGHEPWLSFPSAGGSLSL